MKIVFSAEDLAGDGLGSAKELKLIKERYKDGETSLILLSPKNADQFTTDELCKMRKWYSQVRLQIPELLSSASTFDFKIIEKVSAENKLKTYNLLAIDCDKLTKKFRDTLAKEKLNQSPFALAMDHDKKFNILFKFTFISSTTSKFGSFDPKLFDMLRDLVENDLQKQLPNTNLYWFGPGDYQWYLLEGMKFAKYVNLAMVVLMLIGLRLFFGTYISGFIFVGTLIISAFWLFGLKGAVGSNYDILSTGLILILGISSLEDFIFVSFDQIKTKDYFVSIKKLLIPSFYTSLTTILGFLSLYVSDVAAIRRMGVWAAWGALMEWFAVFIFIPCLLFQFKNFKTWVNPQKNYIPKIFFKSTNKYLPKKLTILSLLIFPLTFWAFPHLDFNVSPIKIFPEKQDYYLASNQVLKTKGWIGNVSLLFDKVLEENEINQIIKLIETDQLVKESVVKIESKYHFKNWLIEEGNIDPIDSELYFSISDLNDQFVDSYNINRILLYVNDTSALTIKALKEKINAICKKNCHIGGEVVTHSEFAELVPKTLMESLLTSLLLVAIVVSIIACAHNKSKLIPALLLSCFWGPFLTIVLLGACHSTLDFWKSIFASILVGLAGDNSIQYLFAAEENNIETGIIDRGPPSIITSALMAIISLVYLGSYFSSPRTFGIILSLGFLSTLVGDLWIFNSYNFFFNKKK
jgi:predicted RND superfamily exporter protein